METENIEYKGINIEIMRDDSPQNPFEDWDGCVPLLYESDYSQDYSNGQILDYLRRFLSYNQIRRHQRRIIELMNKNNLSYFAYSFEDFQEEYPLNEYDRTEMIQDELLYSWLGEGMDNMVAFCEEFGIKHYSRESRGYSKGDYAEVFMCWTPEFEKITGRSYVSMTEETFQCNFDLFEAWAWGDVYGYSVEETGDSCWGFYGDDHEKSGLLEEARANIDHYLTRKKKERETKLKELVKNKVPLEKRDNILEGI